MPLTTGATIHLGKQQTLMFSLHNIEHKTRFDKIQ